MSTQAVIDAREIIMSQGVSWQHFRPAVVDGGFTGPRRGAETDLGAAICQEQPLSSRNLQEKGADAVAFALPDSDIREGDVLVKGGVRFHVENVEPHRLDGETLYLELFLKHEEKDQG